MTVDLVTINDDSEIMEFGDLWDRGKDLESAIRRIPNELILKSGLAARSRSLLLQWEDIEPPSIDGSVDVNSIESLKKWNKDAETLIAYIISSTESGEPDSYLKIEKSIDNIDFIKEAWRWPWTQRARAEKSNWNKGKIIKAGVVAGVGVMALAVFLDKE